MIDRQRNSKFRRGAGVVTCKVCGKRTRDTGRAEGNLEMCAKCIAASGLENMHYDGAHDGAPDPDCQLCFPATAQVR